MLSRFYPVLLPIFILSVAYVLSGVVFASVSNQTEEDFITIDEETVSHEEVRIVVVSDNNEPEPEPELESVSVTDEVIVVEVEESHQNNFSVPFYSQFGDISRAGWQKVGCGIASTAMLIDFYSDETVSVDALLNRGIATGAYLDNAGWIHSGLINLAKPYGLGGQSVSLASLSMSDAFVEFGRVVAEGPVMASVHYTFEPTNPIPHLVIITGVSETEVFYNDPAEPSGGGVLSADKFKKAWKKRYIEIRPT